MKNLIDLFQQLTIEIILLVFNICLLILAIINNANNEVNNFRENLGEVMMIINIIMPPISMAFIAIQILLSIKEIYLERKQLKGQKLEQIKIQNRNHSSVQEEINYSPQLSTRMQESEFNQFDKSMNTSGQSPIQKSNLQTFTSKTFHQPHHLSQKSNHLYFIFISFIIRTNATDFQ